MPAGVGGGAMCADPDGVEGAPLKDGVLEVLGFFFFMAGVEDE